MYLRAVAYAAHIKKGDLVLEVGPGEGTLTRELLSRGAKVVAVEKDDRLIPILSETFAKELTTKQLRLIHGDILAQDFKKLGLSAGKYKVAANIPYYISGALMRFLFEHKEQPNTLSLLVQKEVAERIARSKKESLLSLSVKVYGVPSYVMKVPRGAFVPPPKVDSAILAVTEVSRKHFANAAHEKKFFELIHAGFAHKRKTLGKALFPLIGERVAPIATKRAEDIALKTWLELAEG